jgi:WD40 repeat protein
MDLFLCQAYEGLVADVGSVYIFVFGSNSHGLRWFELVLTNPVILIERDTLQLAQHFHVTSCVLSTQPDEMLVIGSKTGCICVYDLKQTTTPSVVYRRVHSKDSVTSFVLEPIENTRFSKKWMLHSCGKDGMYAKLQITFAKSAVVLASKAKSDHLECVEPGWAMEKLYSTRITKGILSRISGYPGDMKVCGFFGPHFFQYSLEQACELIKVECGGAGRSWDLLETNDNVTFACIRKSSLAIKTSKKLAMFKEPVLQVKMLTQDHYHGLETRVVQVIGTYGEASLICSGGEDGLLTFHSFSPEHGLERVLICKRHQASIRCLKAIRTHSMCEYLLISGGSRQTLKAWRLTYSVSSGKISTVQCVELYTAPHVAQLEETRIMDVDCILSKDGHFVASACSDGYIRVLLVTRHGM